MTDLGKIVLFHGAVLDRRIGDHGEPEILVKSDYRMEDRQRWNPSWNPNESVVIDNQGFMNVWYRDGDDAPAVDEFPSFRPIAA